MNRKPRLLQWSVPIFTLCFSLLTITAHAEPVTLTGGSFIIDRNEDGGIQYGGGFTGEFNNQPFSVGGSGRDDFANIPCSFSAACGPGQTFNLGANIAGASYSGYSVTFNGMTYGADEPLDVTLAFEFVAPDSMIPFFSTQETLTFATSFTFAGGVNPMESDLDFEFRGRGMAELVLRAVGSSEQGNFYQLERATYTAAAVPEPATMVLLGTGLVGVVWNRRKRR